MINAFALTRRQMAVLSAGVAGALLCGSALRALAGEQKNQDADAAQAQQAGTPGTVDADGFVLDGTGFPCVKAGTAKTVLTVNSVATEMVLMLGGEGAAATLGQGFQYGENSLNAKMYPNLADVKTFTRDDCTVENVAAIAPDLVIIDVPETVEALRAAGINAASMAVVSPETIMQAVDLLGAAMGGEAEQKAAAYREAYQGAIDEVSQLSAELAEDARPSVLYLRGIDSTCGLDSMPDNWITTCGGVNVAAELGFKGSRAEIGLEAIMDADPVVIVCESPRTYADLMASEALSELQAIKNGTVVIAPLGPVVWSMGSTEAMLQLYWAADLINPQIFDFDVPAITREYFATFYGYELTDEEIDEILNPAVA